MAEPGKLRRHIPNGLDRTVREIQQSQVAHKIKPVLQLPGMCAHACLEWFARHGQMPQLKDETQNSLHRKYPELCHSKHGPDQLNGPAKIHGIKLDNAEAFKKFGFEVSTIPPQDLSQERMIQILRDRGPFMIGYYFDNRLYHGDHMNIVVALSYNSQRRELPKGLGPGTKTEPVGTGFMVMEPDAEIGGGCATYHHCTVKHFQTPNPNVEKPKIVLIYPKKKLDPKQVPGTWNASPRNCPAPASAPTSAPTGDRDKGRMSWIEGAVRNAWESVMTRLFGNEKAPDSMRQEAQTPASAPARSATQAPQRQKPASPAQDQQLEMGAALRNLGRTLEPDAIEDIPPSTMQDLPAPGQNDNLRQPVINPLAQFGESLQGGDANLAPPGAPLSQREDGQLTPSPGMLHKDRMAPEATHPIQGGGTATSNWNDIPEGPVVQPPDIPGFNDANDQYEVPQWLQNPFKK